MQPLKVRTDLDIEVICSVTGAEARAHDAGMEAATKLHRAGRQFLLRLVSEYGPVGAAGILRPRTP